jgi:hypothetical protein
MKKNLTILSSIFLFIAMILVVFVWGGPIIIEAYLYNSYMKSVTLILIFTIVVYRKRLTWDNYLVYVIAGFAVIGMLIDTSGNPIINKPLALLVSHWGKLQVTREVNNYAPGEFAISDFISILKQSGEVVKLSVIWLYLYRLFQYLVTYAVLGSFLGIFIKRAPQRSYVYNQTESEELSEDVKKKIAEEMRRRQEMSENKYVFSEGMIAQVRELKQRGEIILAIKLVRDYTGMPLGEAKKFVDELNY